MISKQSFRNRYLYDVGSGVDYVGRRFTVSRSVLAKRLTDICLVLASLPIALILMTIVACILRVYSPGPIFYLSTRIGVDGKPFVMPKFRTMHPDTPELPPEKIQNYSHFVTPFGALLRKTSLDELPQIWCILCGKMSLVGPRPASVKESGLIASRSVAGVDRLLPGLTGWAQINGRNSLSVMEKVEYDREYLHRRSWLFDLRIVLCTIPRVIIAKDIRS